MRSNRHIIDTYLSGHLDKDAFTRYSSNFDEDDWVYLEKNIDGLQYESFKFSTDLTKKMWLNILKKTIRKRKLFSIQRLAVAAIVLLTFGITLLLKIQTQSNRDKIFANTSDLIEIVVTPDGSRIRLFPHSELTYSLTEEYRHMTLKGKGTFDILRDTTKPLKVKTSFSITSVLGTVFTLDTYSDSLETLHLHEGSVEYFYKVQKDSSSSVLLKSGGEINYHKQNYSIIQKNLQEELHYRKSTATIELNNADIHKVAQVLKVWYNVELSIPNNLTEKIVHRFDTKKMEIDEVIEGINLIANYKIIKIKENKYKIKEK